MDQRVCSDFRGIIFILEKLMPGLEREVSVRSLNLGLKRNGVGSLQAVEHSTRSVLLHSFPRGHKVTNPGYISFVDLDTAQDFGP